MKFIRPKRSANRRLLSETDISALREALSLIKAQGFTKTRDMTHDFPAYIEAWKPDEGKKSYLMSYGLLIDNNDEDVVSDILHASHYN